MTFQIEIAKREYKDYNIGLVTKDGTPVYGKDLVKSHKWYNPLHQHDFDKNKTEIKAVPHPHINFNKVSIKYGTMNEPVLSNFNWNIPKGSKWILKGSNGSGKSTLTALMTLDHPQSWCNHIDFHDSPVEVGKTNYIDHNSHISSSSPELHNLCLSRNKTVKEVILSGINSDSNNNFRMPKNINEKIENLYDYHLTYWKLTDFENTEFKFLSLNDQKLVLFVRALIKLPELLILDEAFSGMNLETIDKCHYWLDHYWCGTLILVGHLEEELLANCQVKQL
ncbi:P-loop containing nucleoside triphosphate hydrolase protein [Hanseniaspora valbyensis NRRL Y-1626]|uniref:p-loop containing nucleoside triphosphate hydrolase protein n=1 Tax=Hanseniaspora valbyensis NRRL Y-1626 TaxID=766949 RepID=A0A1B7TIR4_9ASCO|nr:P-loop containing nucleoside triphosphate hydrolase protein [Hanseniaspora valbyensis NRRL Y-1626]